MGSPFAANSVGPLHGSDGRCLSVEFSLAAIFSSDSGSLRGPDAPTETAIGGRFDRFPAFDSCHYSDVAPQNRKAVEPTANRGLRWSVDRKSTRLNSSHVEI